MLVHHVAFVFLTVVFGCNIQLSNQGLNATTVQAALEAKYVTCPREQVVELFLNGNDLIELPENLFAGLTAMTYLTLISNQLSYLPPLIFQDQASLIELDLFDNELSSIPDGLFTGLGSLEILWLEGNALTTLPATIFADVPRLQELYLHVNQLTILSAGIFDGLDSLHTLLIYEGDTNGELLCAPEDSDQGPSNYCASVETSNDGVQYFTAVALCAAGDSSDAPDCGTCDMTGYQASVSTWDATTLAWTPCDVALCDVGSTGVAPDCATCDADGYEGTSMWDAETQSWSPCTVTATATATTTSATATSDAASGDVAQLSIILAIAGVVVLFVVVYCMYKHVCTANKQTFQNVQKDEDVDDMVHMA